MGGRLLPKTSDDILREVAEELDLDFKEVKDVFKVWLKYLKYITRFVDCVSIRFPGLGNMYYSFVRHKIYSDGIKKKLHNGGDYHKEKAKYIEENTLPLAFSEHRSGEPVNIKYGTSRRNFSLLEEAKKNKVTAPHFTMDELIRRQNIAFIEEDVEARKNNNFKKIILENVAKKQNLSDTEVKTRPRKIKRKRLV